MDKYVCIYKETHTHTHTHLVDAPVERWAVVVVLSTNVLTMYFNQDIDCQTN